MYRLSLLLTILLLFTACAPPAIPSAQVQIPDVPAIEDFLGFTVADGSRPLTFPEDFGAHEDFRTEWWYYTGNLDTPEGRHFGFELTIFRVGLLPPTAELPDDSQWYGRSIYFAHFAVSDIEADQFHALERFSRPGPGLAGAESDPYRVWIEDWSVAQNESGTYHLQAEKSEISLDLTLTDEMGIVLHGQNGYTRGGESLANAAYYYSQPYLRADGFVQIDGVRYPVSGLAWKDHEFSSGRLDTDQTGWDWFSLHLEDGSALMLYQLRERDGGISDASSGTFIANDGTPQPMQKSRFEIAVRDEWRSPHTGGLYPAAWQIRLEEPHCQLEVRPWMADQELHFPAVTYWEGAVHFEGVCNGTPVRGNGYVELTGYAGNVPLP